MRAEGLLVKKKELGKDMGDRGGKAMFNRSTSRKKRKVNEKNGKEKGCKRKGKKRKEKGNEERCGAEGKARLRGSQV